MKRFLLLALVLTSLGCAEEAQTRVSETNITRDFLQPLGMPIVTGYHKMRENAFLNTKDKNATGLESVGNFFLIPSRYLFGGKTIEKEENTFTYKERPSFHYNKLHWLKTTLAITVLPVSEVVGALCKGLSFLSPSVQKRHDQYLISRFALLPSSKETFQEKTGIQSLYSEEKIPCLHHARPSKLTVRQTHEVQALKDVVSLLEKHEIPYWIDCGTALGAYRYGGFIPWDWDIDLAILLEDHATVKAVLKQLDPSLYEIQDWSSYSKPCSFLKLYVKKTKNFIDIYHYKTDPEKEQLFFYYTYIDSPFPLSWKEDELKCTKPVSYSTIFPLKRASFDGVDVFAPNHMTAFLQSKYGENLEPSNVWNEEKKIYEKVLSHPYWNKQ